MLWVLTANLWQVGFLSQGSSSIAIGAYAYFTMATNQGSVGSPQDSRHNQKQC